MSTLSECCRPCDHINVVNIPGVAGNAGASAFTTTTANFTIPNIGNTVTVSVSSTSFMQFGLNVFVGDANFIISAVNSLTSVTLLYLGFHGNGGDAAPGSVVPTGSLVNAGVGNLSTPFQVGDGGTGVASYSALATALSAFLSQLLGGVPLPVADGGTGVTTIAALGTALNAALSNILGGVPLSIANGGTNAATVTTALSNLGVAQAMTAAYASGAAYTLTTVSALLAFGTTSPTVTIPTTGVYRLRSRARIDLVGTTYAANQTVTLKLRRTAAVAGDIPNATTTTEFDIVTTKSYTAFNGWLPEVEFSATAGDVIQLWGAISANTGAGSVQAVEATLLAVPLHLP